MALPKIDTPTYQLTIPSTQQQINYRPFLVKEQKIIMMAQESKDEDQMIHAVSDLVEACTFGKINAKNSPTFDVEYIFLKIRSKSVGETVELSVTCPDDETTQTPVKLNLEDIELMSDVRHKTEIKITDTIKLNLRYPMLSDMLGLKGVGEFDTPFKILQKCVKDIHYGDDVYQRVDITDKELEEFIDQLTGDQFKDIMEFFDTMPKMRHVVEVTNPKTNVKGEVVLEGLQNFLG